MKVHYLFVWLSGLYFPTLAQEKLDFQGFTTVHIQYPASLAGTKVRIGTYHSFPRNEVSEITDPLPGNQ